MAEVVEIKQENLVYAKPKLITENVMHYCPGCSHGTIHKLVAEVIDEMGMEGKTIAVSPVGCSVFAYNYIDVDWIQAAHGRACAVATAAKRLHPDSLVFTYQGDGDMSAIGTGETIHAAARGENIVAIYINNAIYGMTGGQMAPTTLVGQKATTAQDGRKPEREGYPMKMCEILSQLEAPVFIARCGLDTPAHINEAKKALRKGFQNQLDKKGFSFIELMSNCPTNWGMSAEKTIQWMQENTLKTFPLGVFKEKE